MWYRSILHALVVTVWIVQEHGIFAQMCSSRKNFRHIQEDTAITGSTFLTLTGLGLVGCSKQCLLRSACQSFNYEPSTQECQLNKNSSSTTESENVKNVVGTISSDISNWPSKLAGSCSSRGCPGNAVCVERINDMTCKVECPNPTLQNGSITSPISHDVGTVLIYECDANFKATGNAICRADGTWSVFSCIQGCLNPPNVLNAELITPETEWPTGSTLEYTCKGSLDKVGSVSCLSDGTWTEMKCVARNCSAVLQCNRSYGDGEYWLYSAILHDKPVKIYCHNMNSGNPLEYLTLPEENYADYSDLSCNVDGYLEGLESTRFYKLRITDISQLLTNSQGLLDRSFVNISNPRGSLFAALNDCHASCGESKSSEFVMNTKGTGLLLDPTQEWVAEEPDTTPLQPVTIEKIDSGRHIVIHCHQPCRACYPAGVSLGFVLDEDQSVDTAGAVSPSC